MTIDIDAAFGEYVDHLSKFFAPSTREGMQRLIGAMFGEIVGAEGDPWRLVPSSKTFRQVVVRGEMQPDQWPKYRYLMLELWRPSNESLKVLVEQELTRCRKEVVAGLVRYSVAQLAKARGSFVDEISQGDLDGAVGDSVSAVAALVKNLQGRDLDEAAMRVWAVDNSGSRQGQ